MKRTLALLLALGLLATLVACGGSGSTAPAASPAPAPAGSAAPTPAPVSDKTVVYWSMWNANEPQGEAIKAGVEAFTAQTGIKVDLQLKGRDGIRQGLEPALNSNVTIDLFDEDIDRVNTSFKSYLADLEELAKKYNYEETALTGLISACREVGDGKLMSIPYQPNVFAFFYNEEIFAEAGVTAVPTTWDELLAACEKIKAAGFIPITCDDAYITCMIGYHLSRAVGEERTREIVKNGEWDDPAVRAFADNYAELAAKGYFSPNIAANVWPAGQNFELAAGTAAMYLNGSWLPNEVKDFTGPDFKWGCFSYPTLPGGKTGTEAANFGAQVFAISNKSQVSDEAFQLICFLTKGEHDQNLSALSVGIPADTANINWPAMLTNVKPVMDSLSVRYTWAAGAEANENMTPAIKENVLKLCGGSITADQFIANLKVASGR